MYYFKINLKIILEQEQKWKHYIKWTIKIFHFKSMLLRLWIGLMEN
jgi:hypothetical protein